MEVLNKKNLNEDSPMLFDLVKSGHTWRRVLTKEDADHTPNYMQKIPPAEDGDWKWKVCSSIQFRYTVEKVCNSFALDSTAMLASPSDETSKMTANNRAVNTKKLRRIVFVDEEVYEFFQTKIEEYFTHHNVEVSLVKVLVTEKTKTVGSLLGILKKIDEGSPDRRNEPIIAIGGGVLMDLVGLAASLYRRRTPYIRVPTTLLGLVDASVGGKTGVNFCNGKNKLGAYVPPFKVIIDSSFLSTLPHRHICNGMGEILKMALVKSKKLFELLETFGEEMIKNQFNSDEGDMAIQIAIETMLEELAPNMWEDDLDRLVDFGHVLSPPLEMAALPELLHGEAVNIDMSFMCVLSHTMGHLSLDNLLRIIRVMKSLELPIYHEMCTLEFIQSGLKGREKHSSGKLRLPIPKWIGKAEIIDYVPSQLIRQAESTWARICAKNPLQKS